MRQVRGLLFFCSVLLLIMLFSPFTAQANSDLLNYLPLGANIIQCFALADFDYDADNEYLVLYALQDNYAVTVLDLIDGRYQETYFVNLGRGNTKTGGKVKMGETGYSYRILQVDDLDGDGVLEFWTLFHPEGSTYAELTMHKYKNNCYLAVFTARGQYDLQFMDYGEEFVVHEVNYENGKTNSPLLTITSRVWDLRDHQLKGGEEAYQLTREDYRHFARSRQRPVLFGPGAKKERTVLCWGNSLNKLAEIPLDERALLPLLPGNANLLEWELDPALDDDVDEEYVFTYLLPDPESPSKIRIQAALADWDFERCRYQLVPLPFEAYGRARDQEGYLYKSVYILHGNGLNHLAFLGNGAELPSLKFAVLNNNGLFFEEAAVFNANWHLQFLECYRNQTLSYQVITADRDKETGLVKTKVFEAFPEGAYDEFGLFLSRGEEILTTRNYKKEYYHIEEPVWSGGGYEYLLLETFHEKIDPFANRLPGTTYSGPIDDYIFKYLTPFRIHHWSVQDLDRDGGEEALLLLRTDHDLWGWPEYRVGLLKQENGFQLQELGPVFSDLGEGNPASGVYLADIVDSQEMEIIFLRREYDLKTRKRKIGLEIYSKQGPAWKRAHEIDFVYDDLRLCAVDGEVWLFGFDRDGQNNQEGAVYGFQWRDGRFNYQAKSTASGLEAFLATLSPRRIDFFTPQYMVFPPGAERSIR
ncbi:MAG TPA: hypothetical protein GXZ98_03975 [Firmicutes bacterium]|jgi:hypothetical protein|nr:hypothetical protein [Bacillota bacterium]